MDWNRQAQRWKLRRAMGALPAVAILMMFAFDIIPPIPRACLTPTSRYVEVHAPDGAAVLIDGELLEEARSSPTFPGQGPSHFPSLPLHETVQLRVEHKGRVLEEEVVVSGEPNKVVWEVTFGDDDGLTLVTWAAED